MELMHIPNWLNKTLGDEFQNIFETVESKFDATGSIDNIEHNSYDGFIPFTNGGLEFTAEMRLEDVANAATFPNNEAVTEELTRAINYGYEQARELFIEHNREALSELFTTEQIDSHSGDINYHTLYSLHQGELAESLSEYEMENNQETFFIQHRAMFFSADNHRNITGEDEIYFYSGVNTDYEYGRDKGLMDCFETTVKVGDLTPNKVKNIIKQMLHSV